MLNSTIRKALTALAGVAVSAAMLATGVAPAMAAGETPAPAPVAAQFTPDQLKVQQPLTVTAGEDISGKTLKAIRLGTYTAGSYTGDLINGYDITTSNFAANIDTALKANVFDKDDKNQPVVPTDGYDAANPIPWVAQNLLDSQTTPYTGRLRNLLTALAKDQAVTGDKAAVTLTPVKDNKNKLSATVDPGLYLIVDQTAQGKASIPMMIGTGINNLTKLAAKTGDPKILGSVEYKPNDTTVEKKIVEGDNEVDNNTAQIGDTVTYRLKTTVPNWTGYDKFQLILHDTLSKGLTFKGVTKVQVNNKDVAKDTQYKLNGPTPVQGENADGANEFSVVFAPTADGKSNVLATDELKALFPVNAQVVVEYTAVLNKDAKISTNAGSQSNDNTVDLQYSHNPNNFEDLEKTPGDTTHTYTGRFNLHKVDAAGQPLAGAEFTIAKTPAQGQTAQPITLVAVSQAAKDNNTDPNIYRPAVEGEKGDTKFVTPNSGNVIIQGLDHANYTVTETKSPLGAPALPSFTLTIVPTDGMTDKVAGKNTVTEFKGDANNLTSSDSKETVTVKNVRNLLEMPKTGASWLAIYAAGFVACALGAGILLRKQRA